jgi:hypothetical protein
LAVVKAKAEAPRSPGGVPNGPGFTLKFTFSPRLVCRNASAERLVDPGLSLHAVPGQPRPTVHR